MGFLSEGLEPLKQAQEELLLRLDAMLVELRTMSEILREVHTVLARQQAAPEVAASNGQVSGQVVAAVPDLGA